MCHHSFCDMLRFKRIKGDIRNNKFYIWIYTKRNKEFLAYFFKESFGNYKVFTGLLRDIDGGCYEKCITRLIIESGIMIDKDFISSVFQFSNPVICFFDKTPVFIGFSPNLPKKRIQFTLRVYEKIELFTLYGECPANKWQRNERAMLDIRTNDILQFSIDDEWIHKLPK